MTSQKDWEDYLREQLSEINAELGTSRSQPGGAADEGLSLFVGLYTAIAECEAPKGTQVDDVLAEYQPAFDLASATDHATCLHCGRAILRRPTGVWICPEAGYDDEDGDGIWRETCPDNHEDRIAAHEPGGIVRP